MSSVKAVASAQDEILKEFGLLDLKNKVSEGLVETSGKVDQLSATIKGLDGKVPD